MRAGLHTGECELVGDDIGGIAVHIGARVGALAGAGEVLVSSTVKDLVAGSGISFADRGAHSSKGCRASGVSSPWTESRRRPAAGSWQTGASSGCLSRTPRGALGAIAS